jgi:pSer/pThr/pTyr-binding forkhead associated (FHA) protein
LPTVVVKTGSEAGRRLELGGAVAIGRQDGDLVLEDPEVSRRHAVLRREGESIVVEDLDSTNGTFVNGERIRSPLPIGPGDLVRVGRTTLEIEPDLRSCRHPYGQTTRS